MVIDESVYPDIDPPSALHADEEKGDYLHRLCGAWDFGIVPEEATVRGLAGWKHVFDRFPLPASPAYHALRTWFGWEPVPAEPYLSRPYWKALDEQEGRTDPCEEWV